MATQLLKQHRPPQLSCPAPGNTVNGRAPLSREMGPSSAIRRRHKDPRLKPTKPGATPGLRRLEQALLRTPPTHSHKLCNLMRGGV